MPKKKSARPLSTICVTYISQNMERFCNESEVGEQVDGADAIDVGENTTNPFQQLPSVLLEAIITEIIFDSVVGDEQEAKFLLQLITPLLSTLNLCFLRSDFFHYIFGLASGRCKQLKTLRLDDCCFSNSDCLDFIPNFSNLQALNIDSVVNIKFTLSGDDLFHFLGAHCKDLRELSARDNQVSDAGIHGLCVIGNCKLLRVLNVGHNPITSRGIRMALDNLPLLKLLNHESLLEGLESVAQTALDQKIPDIPNQFSLSWLYFAQRVFKCGTLGQSLLLCPYITDLHLILRLEGITNADLLSILSLKTVYVLNIKRHIKGFCREYPVPFDKSVTFDGGILPLLKSFGKSLKILKIEGCFLDIDTSAVVQLCPNLHSLSLIRSHGLPWNEHVERKQVKAETEFPVLMQLTNLFLEGGLFTILNPLVSSKDLLKLLSSPLLSFVHLASCYTLTDAILQKANDLHSFRNLKCLEIIRCRFVTKKGIDVLMQENNPLQKIFLFICTKIADEDLNSWIAMGIEKNWQLESNDP